MATNTWTATYTTTTMVTTIEAASGKVGNLTPEQEAKVQEFWKCLIKLWRTKPDALDGTGGSLPLPPVRTASLRSTSSPSRVKDAAGPVRKLSFIGRTGSRASIRTANSTSASSSASSDNDNNDPYEAASIDDKYGISKDYHRRLADLTPEQIRKTFWNMVKYDNPDAVLLRYLRACTWDVRKALAMLISSIHWRCINIGIDDMMQKGETFAYQRLNSRKGTERREAIEFVHQMRSGKVYIHGVDKLNRPIIYIHVRNHRTFEQSNRTMERLIAYTSELALLIKSPQEESVVSDAL